MIKQSRNTRLTLTLIQVQPGIDDQAIYEYKINIDPAPGPTRDK